MIVHTLLSAGARVNAVNSDGRTALGDAMMNCHAEVAAMLREPERSAHSGSLTHKASRMCESGSDECECPDASPTAPCSTAAGWFPTEVCCTVEKSKEQGVFGLSRERLDSSTIER